MTNKGRMTNKTLEYPFVSKIKIPFVFFFVFKGDKGDKGDRGLTATLKGDQLSTSIIEGPPGPPGPPGWFILSHYAIVPCCMCLTYCVTNIFYIKIISR